jgi:hypothetical protein
MFQRTNKLYEDEIKLMRNYLCPKYPLHRILSGPIYLPLYMVNRVFFPSTPKFDLPHPHDKDKDPQQ